MTSWMKNHIANLHNAVSGPLEKTQDTLAKILSSVHETASLL